MPRNKEDEGLLVRFYKEIVQAVVVGEDGADDSTKVVEQDCISIIIPGSRDEHCAIMSAELKVRFKDEYATWKAAAGAPIMGLPLEEWPQATSVFVTKMHSFGIRSVEELANMPETFAVEPQTITMRARAQAWLAAGGAPSISAAELDAAKSENEALKSRIAALEKAAKAKKAKKAPAITEMTEAELEAATAPQ